MDISANILMYAFRYALGRRTGAVSEVCEVLIRNWDYLSEDFKQRIKLEIKKAAQDDMLGDHCDKEQWFTLLNLK